MKNIFIILLAIIILSGCSTTMKYTAFKGKYSKFLEQGETEIESAYHYVFTKKQDGSYVYRQFFPETMTLTELVTFGSNKKTKNGPAVRYTDDGNLSSEGNYSNNLETGKWFIKGVGTGNFVAGNKEGEWVIKDKTGKLEAKYNYVKNVKEGPFIKYDSLGNVDNEGVYKADTIFYQTKTKVKSTDTELMPRFPASCPGKSIAELDECAKYAMLEYIYKKLRYPVQARVYGVQGQAIVQFVVDVDGNIIDINVIRGVCKSIKDEVIRLVKSFPKFHPGIQNGKPVKVLYTLPIKFKLS